MKKLILIMVVATLSMSAQSTSTTVQVTTYTQGDYTKLIANYKALTEKAMSGGAASKAEIKSISESINCGLTELQAKALVPTLLTTRNQTCGSKIFPGRPKAVKDADYKIYTPLFLKYAQFSGQ